MNNNILLISNTFYPDIDATGQIMTDLAEDLSARGLKLQVITGRNQKDSPKQENYRGIEIKRVPMLHLNKRVLPFRFLNYISFFPSVFFTALTAKRPDAIFIVSSPPFMYFLGWLLKKFRRTRLIFNVQDLYPDIAVRLGLIKQPIIIRLLERLTLKMYKQADLIICIGDKMAKMLIERGCPAVKIEIIENWSDGSQIYPIEKRSDRFVQKNGLSDKFIVQYSGNFGMVHELDTVLLAAKALAERTDIEFVFIGGGVNAGKIKSFVSDHGLANVKMFPFQPRESLNDSLNAADVSLVTLKAGFAGTVIPSKIYGIMASGKPVLAVCPGESEASRIVKENDCGLVVDPGDADGCRRAILSLNDDRAARLKMGENARRAFMEKYDRPLMTEKYYLAIRRLFPSFETAGENPLMDVSVCLVNHNAKAFTLKCIESIYKNTKGISFEIILIDNASGDGTVAAVERAFPEVKIIANDSNLGFAAANNQGIRIANGENILLLNNDTELKNEAIKLMLGRIRDDRQIGILTCKLLRHTGKTQKNCRSFYKTPFDTLFGRASLMSRLFPGNPITKRNTLSDWSYDSARRVDWVSGACMMIKRKVFDSIGPLDERYFLYWEDTDFCKRASDAGWQIWFIPEAEIVHYTGQGGGTRSLWLKLFTMSQMHYSAYYYFCKHHYHNPLHPMSIITFLSMIGLIAVKGMVDVVEFPFKNIMKAKKVK